MSSADSVGEGGDGGFTHGRFDVGSGAAEQGNAPSTADPRGPGTGFDPKTGHVATHLGTTARDELDKLGYDPATGTIAVAVEGENDQEKGMGALGGFKDPIEGNFPQAIDQRHRLELAAARAMAEEKKKEEEMEKKT